MNSTATITRLRSLIDHPRTGAEERDAAQRILDRLLVKTARSTDSGGGSRIRRDGPGRHARIDVVADAIRTDIAVARMTRPASGDPGVVVHDPIPGAPDGVGYDVVADGDSVIVVTIESVPPDWGWVDDAGVATVSPELRALADRIADVVDGYNAVGTDGVPRFFGRVRVPGHTLVW